jgi:hypothetical protein
MDVGCYDIELHKRSPGILIAALCLAIAPSALALPVAVAFSGNVSSVVGTAPGGIVESTAFSGSSSYDPDADQNPSTLEMELAASAFSLQLNIGNSEYRSDSQTGPLRTRYSVVGWFDEDGEPAEPDDPGSLAAVYLSGVGTLRDVASHDEFAFSLSFTFLFDRKFYLDQLPPTSLDLTEVMSPGPWELVDRIYIGDLSDPTPYSNEPLVCGTGSSGFCIEGTLTGATPVPEPTATTLLLLGLAVVGAEQRARRNR